MIGPIKPFNTIGSYENHNLQPLFFGQGEWPLSGYLAGRQRGGYCVRALEDAWCETFGAKHAIACNSATSALLAACEAADVGIDTRVITTPFTMSATAAAPAFLGADIGFADIEDSTFSMVGPFNKAPTTKALVITNLFGHPAILASCRKMCDRFGWLLIEDNAQSPFAMEGNKYAGTIGHIGCWSLNVHKHIQSGEGGICTTDDDALAARIRAFINHGEHVSDRVGLNLRMPELCAAVALTQLRRGKEMVQNRVEQAEALIAAIGDIPGLRPPVVRDGCKHVYYTVPFLVDNHRAEFCAALREQGVPIHEGYVDPIYRMPAFKQFAKPCPVAEDMHDRRLLYIENCAWDFTAEQIKQVGDAFKRAAESCLIAP
jgi:perosamine synthetase